MGDKLQLLLAHVLLATGRRQLKKVVDTYAGDLLVSVAWKILRHCGDGLG